MQHMQDAARMVHRHVLPPSVLCTWLDSRELPSMIQPISAAAPSLRLVPLLLSGISTLFAHHLEDSVRAVLCVAARVDAL
jgi:hypothetical protein